MVFGKNRSLLSLAIAGLAFSLAACQAPPESSSQEPMTTSASASISTDAAAPGAGERCILPEHRNYLLGTWSGRWENTENGSGSTLEITLFSSRHKGADYDIHVRHHVPTQDYGGMTVEYDSVAYIRDCNLVVVSSRDEERWWHFDLIVDRSDATKASLDAETRFGDDEGKPVAIVLDYTSFDAQFIWPRS